MRNNIVPETEKNKKEDSTFIYAIILISVIGIAAALIILKLIFEF